MVGIGVEHQHAKAIERQGGGAIRQGNPDSKADLVPVSCRCRLEAQADRQAASRSESPSPYPPGYSCTLRELREEILPDQVKLVGIDTAAGVVDLDAQPSALAPT